ncbi:malonate transporter [Candidatus Rhodobacter oscarellae]|uniref:Malonate transporter n=1 Tax=Candidatus Rhodobacter oscarellae TaxID=1675527 RepID=A0A0J9E7D5_9RHOB|nr:AEC family transporter [Candidatus Rhodobacter lobularis]KMW57704.1 malonate transporter [Candidatus Rhodobacter lobularis]
MAALLSVILPVFLVVGFGYVSVWRSWLSDEHISGLMKFAQNFAIPCLLFVAIARLDLGQTFSTGLIFSFYAGSTTGFLAGLLGARFLFGRPWEDCVAIGFATLFSNSVLMGLAITERAYGADALGPNYAIVAIHAPYCYILGFVVMELVRARGAGARQAARAIGGAIIKNALMIGIALGFLVNITGIPLPDFAWDGVELMARAGLPAALFGLGGVLFRYRPEGDMATIAYVCAVSLLMHPLIVWVLGRTVELSTGEFRSAVLTAAMAPGVNAYIFANMYGVARRVVASSVLIGTGLTVISASIWLSFLP